MIYRLTKAGIRKYAEGMILVLYQANKYYTI